MEKVRLEAFTDAVIAVVITIMVLELRVPGGSDFESLAPYVPELLVYVLSYINVAILWNNHHHMLQAADRVDGRVLWANLFLLFWTSLIPFVIRWMDETHYPAVPTAAFGVVLAMSGIGYLLLEWRLIACNGATSRLARAVGREAKGKLSLLMYGTAILLAFVHPWIAIGLYVAVALMWFLPDPRIESVS